MRLLGLDVGEKRIGVSLGDTETCLARPLEVIERRSRRADFEMIGQLVRKWEVSRVIVGLPLTSEGEVGPQARRVKRYTRELARSLPVPIDFVDERYTTVDAYGIMQTVGYSYKKKREQVDAVAAALILQSFLDCHREQESSNENAAEDKSRDETSSA